MAKNKLIMGKISFSVGDIIEVLAQGRKYRLKIVEIDDYNNILGEDQQGNPIYIKISKISVIRRIDEKEFYSGEKNGKAQ
ncbi:hypothetical protein AFV8_gp07 [Betalipothrixvirus puteoliense]|uniref:Uncharacterized protein n=2 Tax=Betalipothrixvirus TaxID=341940 RepID=A7WKG4_9VIRU|nr:hypothetical protein AFV6_gp10 [Acidianus filamentous virus 6]YP_001604288.1 hypothetical protein AFV8_gp07 [Acidianus filamentous virus 8]CAJ31564.1 conserved hypothetical protein [Acidianus filamentous virus 6]CAJ31684.1 conserved hypothetical protein [Acidianus filamentous virus 8]